MSREGLTLAADFDEISDDTWRSLVEQSLRGKPFEQVMESKTYDGLSLKALYTQHNSVAGPRPLVREGPWHIAVPHWNPDVDATRKAILEDLERGADFIALRIAAGAFPGVKLDDIPTIFEDIYLNMVGFTLIPGEEFVASSEAMLALLQARGYKKDEVQGCLGVEPISTLAQTGRLLTTVEDTLVAGVKIAQKVSRDYKNVATFMVDGGLYHIGGATEAQELGLMLATSVQYLRAMEAAGMSLELAAKQIHFSLVADADIYLTIAKFRAARLLWQQVLESCGVSETIQMNLSGVSSLRMVSARDPWVNILRGTSACFAAGVGGADTICVLPHDTMLGMSSSFARRIARNIQIVLQEESGLSGVMDPAAGAYSFESITLDLSNKAWKYFQKIENKGGIVSALRHGVVQQDMIEAWSGRHKNIATRKDAITGVSEFPNIHEKPIENIGSMPEAPAEIKPAEEEIQPVMFHRLAESFEAFRAVSDSMAEDGSRPSIFLAALGTAAEYTARATFSKNLFEAGGIEALPSEGGEDIDTVINAFTASGAKLAVICGTDDLYKKYGISLTEGLLHAGAKVFIAGKPANMQELEGKGLEGAIFMGVNALAVYEHAYGLIGEMS